MNQPANREMELFQAAAEIADPEERRAFLVRECGPDEQLRNAVEDLLIAQDNAEQFFTLGATSVNLLATDELVAQAATPGEFDPQTFEESPGTMIGRYRIVRKIGEGGCGIVYLAQQDTPMRRQVALKVIKLGMDTRSVIARFEAERQALAIMDHPGIARVFDAGATDAGRPYFVMEFVDGVKITEFCDRQKLGVEPRLTLFIDVCQAIQHAHQKGIIHRDIKPSNVLVTARDGAASIKVIDFGIAKATEERSNSETVFTAYAQLIGTPAYMSPEQVDIHRADLDTRSDIYSLGVLLYELLTGQTPFDSQELTSAGVDEMRRILREREPRTPSARLLALQDAAAAGAATQRDTLPARLSAQLCGDLDGIVMKALEKERGRRYDSATDLAMDIRRFLNNEPVLARPPTRWYLLKKLIRRNRLVVASGASIVAILLAGAVTSTWLLLKERDARRKLVAAEAESKSRRDAEMLGRVARARLLLEQNSFEPADQLFDGIILAEPTLEAAAALRKLGDWHAAAGRWQPACARLLLLVQANLRDTPEVATADYLRLGVALIQSGDLNGYERVRQEGMARFATLPSASVHVLEFSLLLPANRQIMKDLVPQADLAEATLPMGGQPGAAIPDSEARISAALALFQYRVGGFSKAADWGNRCLAAPEYVASQGAAAQAILAMSRWQMSQHEGALSALGLARVMLAGKYAVPPAQKVGSESSWVEREFARILVRECDQHFLEADRSLAQLSSLKPSSDRAPLFRVLGDWHAVRYQWREASERFEAVLQVNQRSFWEHATMDFLACGTTLVKTAQWDAYARFRVEAVRRFKGTDSKEIAERIVKVCLLQPANEKLLETLSPFEAVLSRPFRGNEGGLREHPGFEAWSTMTLGLLEYRRARWDKAAEWARQSLASPHKVASTESFSYLILAMALHQSGQQKEALDALQKGRAFFEINADNVDLSNWRDWLFGTILLRESTILLTGADQPVEARPQ